MIRMAKSDDHIWRCVDVIKNDKSISENTIVLMFLEYKRLLLDENERRTSSNMDKTKGRGN